MAQHFLLSAQARTLSVGKVMRLSDEEAYSAFRAIRWAENDSKPICPKCGCVAVCGYVKPANRVENRIDRRLALNQNGKRRVVIVMRERAGRTLPFVSKSEHEGLPTISASVAPGSTIYADDAKSWDSLHAHYATKRINHSECYSDGEACTNYAESYFSRLRRAEIGTHHKIAGPYLGAYADEMAWREDNRRRPNGALYLKTVRAALAHPVSRQWKGYWQRHVA